MMRLFSFLIISISAMACSSQQKADNSSYEQLIKGDWIYQSVDTGVASSDRTSTKVIFTFEDSLCSLEHPFSDFVTYTLRGDSILTSVRNYKILKLTGDSLVLDAPAAETKTTINSTVRLSKVKSKNTIVPSKIFFASSVCFGKCPSMLVEIDSTGQFVFLGENFTEKKGGFRGQLDKKQYDVIVNKVRNLSLDSLQERYDAGWTDDQNCGVAILTSNKQIVSSVYGYDKEPLELRILIHKLMEVYKTVALKADGTVTNEYFFLKLDGVNIGKPPPAAPVSQ